VHYLAHDELVVACPKEQAEEVADFLEEVMVVGRDKVVNPGLDTDNLERVPVKVEAEVVDSWGEG
jgi:DNA polymerase I-like protein with 3'-5' exonuclease and polymerase domains